MTLMTRILLAVVAAILVISLMVASAFVSANNAEVRLRQAISAKQLDNTNQFDAMWKEIQQVAQVSEKNKDALKEIFTSYADARAMKGEGGALATWIKESVPNVDLSTYKNLQNIIVSTRESFKTRQSELIDLKREHDILLETFPNSIIFSILNRDHISIKIVTSTRTDKTFESGKDDDVNVF